MMGPCSKAGVFLGVLFVSMYVPLPVRGQESLDPLSAVMVVRHEGQPGNNDADRTITYTAQAVEQAFSAAGIQTLKQIIKDGNGEISPEQVQDACLEAGVRWGLMVYTSLKESRLFWHFGVYDAEESMVRTGDTFFTFVYAGISSRNAVEQSAQRVAAYWQKSFTGRNFDGVFAIRMGQRFTSPQEGVRVYFGDENGSLLGKIEKGSLTAPLFLFREGAAVYGSVIKEGYWTKTFFLPKGVTDTEARLPVLQKVTHHSFGFIYAFRGNNEYAFDAEYRYHFLPDRLFLTLNWMFWMDPAKTGTVLAAQEVQVSPGLYLLPWRDLAVRVLAGAGASLVFPEKEIPKVFFYPLWLGLEYHFSRCALKAEIRFPLPVNAAWYYQMPKGMWQAGALGIYFSIGVVLKC
jgi:hypothetical protein